MTEPTIEERIAEIKDCATKAVWGGHVDIQYTMPIIAELERLQAENAFLKSKLMDIPKGSYGILEEDRIMLKCYGGKNE